MATRPRLGELLVEAGLLSMEQLEQVLQAQRQGGLKLGQVLSRLGLVREEQVVETLGRQLSLKRYQAESYPLDMDLARLLPLEIAQKHNVVPLRRQNHVLQLGMCDPTDLDSSDMVEQLTQCEVDPVICTTRELNQLVSSLYGSFAGLDTMLETVNDSEAAVEETSSVEIGVVEDVEVGSLLNMAAEAPVVRMVNWIIAQAVREGASDIHISPEVNHVQLRFRIDGKLREVPAPAKALHLSIVSRIKILAQMDIAVSRVPQDGRMTVRIDNREINIRVSTIPTTHGENVVLRLLDMSAFNYTLLDLGMDEHDRGLLHSVLDQPYGMILSTGPTGCGKTTSLYAMLQELNKPDINIITVEDPVEYRIPKIRQLQLNVRAGMTFASGLRAILRQDPDVIMVGEIRDAETAQIATQAALTGHRVFSTVHTNDAAGAITRLIDMGIEPFIVSSVLLLSFAQRLVRRVCQYCGQAFQPTEETLRFWGLPADGSVELMRATGCARCLHSGYKGRVGVFEVLLVDDLIKTLISKGKTTLEINHEACANGHLRRLREDAAEKLRQRLTTPEEAVSVVSL